MCAKIMRRSMGTEALVTAQVAGDSAAHVVCAKSVRCATRRACGLRRVVSPPLEEAAVTLTQFGTTARLRCVQLR